VSNLDDLMLPVGVVALLGFAVFSGGDNAIGSLTGANGAGIKQLRDSLAQEQVMTETSMGAVANRSEVALQRYERGCTVHYMVAAEQLPEHVAMGGITVTYMPVIDGDTPLHPQTGQRYSRGTVLCDNIGNTALIDASGVATDSAYTGADIQSYVKAFFDRRW
jgi:hypothetical protein